MSAITGFELGAYDHFSQSTALITEDQSLLLLGVSVRRFLYSGVWKLAKRDAKSGISVC